MAWDDPLYFSQAETRVEALSLAPRDHGDVGSGCVPGTSGRAGTQTSNGGKLEGAWPASCSLTSFVISEVTNVCFDVCR